MFRLNVVEPISLVAVITYIVLFFTLVATPYNVPLSKYKPGDSSGEILQFAIFPPVDNGDKLNSELFCIIISRDV